MRASIDTVDLGAEGAQLLVDLLVATVDLLNVADGGDAVGGEGGENEGHAGADVGAGDRLADQTAGTDDDGAMRVAEDDLRAHGDELVDEVETALVHLLMDDDGAFGLGGGDEGDAHEIGRKGRPRCVVDLRHGAAEVGLDAQALCTGDDQVLALIVGGWRAGCVPGAC